MKPKLLIDFCTHAAAEYACKHWHYSKTMVHSKTINFGVWENEEFIGSVVFGRSHIPFIGSPFRLKQNNVCQLGRIALREHQTPVSRILMIAVRMLKQHCPNLRLIVTFADSAQGHHGGIYQACGWSYLGVRASHAYRVNGVIEHPKTLWHRYGGGGRSGDGNGQSIPWLRANVDPNAERILLTVKLKYAYGYDDEIRDILRAQALPYPKPSDIQNLAQVA